MVSSNERLVIYDIIFISSRSLYVFTASDHAIVSCREHVSMGGQRTTYSIHNKIYHNLIHTKLCYSEKARLLCSIASGRVIYGWDIDGSIPLFHLARHSDFVTDFVAIDDVGCFCTCSMDKRIVLWSTSTRRVKGVLVGHKRGVRTMDKFKTLLISTAFETEGRLWDTSNKECIAILRGHRKNLTAAKLMCDRASSPEDYRAITVDEDGELRLWSIFIKEKTSEPYQCPVLQTFEMQNRTYPMCQIRFLAIPNNPKRSTSYYSNLIACSTKLMEFLPEKNAKEFVPPTCMVYNDPVGTFLNRFFRSVFFVIIMSIRYAIIKFIISIKVS